MQIFGYFKKKQYLCAVLKYTPILFMKNKFLLFFLALSMAVMAGERSAIDAAAMAAEFMNQQVNAPTRKANISANAMQLSHTRMKLNSAEPAFYVFNQTSNNGFVVISADDRTEDVLMYSDEGQLDVENANPNLKFWLGRLQEEISAANDENTFTSAEKKARKATTVTAIGPLLKNKSGQEITWYQEAPYWNQCPTKNKSTCLTGCVATAAAQIMYKWRHPEKGTGSHSYSWNSKTLSIDFSTVTFDWDNMLPAYDGVSSTTAQKNAVATLMYCCGVACDMEYGTSSEGGSGAYTDVLGKGITTYLGYTAEKFITMYPEKGTKDQQGYGTAEFSPAEYSVTTAKFKEYFNADLEAGRPIIMGGEDSDGGHEFVCDGRDASGNFHINWGWEGDGNCYCALTLLKPTGTSYNFSSNLDAMIGLQPAVVDTVHVTGVSVAPTTLTLKQKESSTLTATVAPTDATDKTVTWSSSDSKIASVSAAGVVTGVAQGSATITATTKDGGKKATCSVTVTNEVVESKTFTLITDTKNLAAGMEVLIVNEEAQKAISTTQNSNNRAAADVTISNNKISLDAGQSSVEVFTLVKGTATDSWAFMTSAGQYIYAASSSSNYLKTKKDMDANSSFMISIASSVATMTAQGTYTHNTIMYNAGNKSQEPLFSCYLSTSTTMKAVALYGKKSDTAIETAEASAEKKSQKVLLNGQLYILYEGHLYNAQGNVVK